MTIRRLGLALAAAGLAVGCASTGSPLVEDVTQDIEFIRGCWVMKKEPGGEVLAFLRLLPPSADARSYDGQVQVVSGANPGPRTQFSFARDGSSMTRNTESDAVFALGVYRSFQRPFAYVDPGFGRSAYFMHRAEPQSWLVVEGRVEPGRTDTLMIEVRELQGGLVEEKSREEFRGERDGCD